MDGFKLDIFNREAGINRSTGELLLYDWSSTKSCLDPDSIVTNRIVVLSVMPVMFKSFQKTLGSSQGNNPEQANSDLSGE